MIRIALLACLGVSLTLAPRVARADFALRCDGGIISVGDSKLHLLARCGSPALVEELVWPAPSGQRAAATVETWSYNFGPNQFLRFVTLVSGKVVNIELGSYGYPPDQLLRRREPGRARCDSAALRVGDRKLDLLAKCGEPDLRESRLERRGDGTKRRPAGIAVQVEVWTYDFGPQHFVRHVTLENGKVLRIDGDGYGYAR